MQLRTDGSLDLTYCTNVHPARGIDAVTAAIAAHAPPVRDRVAPGRRFGVGLRLSGEESRELLAGNRLEQFKAFLDEHGLYVSTINGFPHGTFHRGPVKADVHAPDWRTAERVDYTLRLAEILAALLSAEGEGGISTSPLTYRHWVDRRDPGLWELLTRNVARVTEGLVRTRRASGRLVHVDIEPEADGLLETSEEVERFFSEHLLAGGARHLAAALGEPVQAAREHLLEHVRVCLDACHVAVAFEEPADFAARLAASGIRIGKVQLSAALRLDLPGDTGGRSELRAQLAGFAEDTYLHQVVARHADGSLARWRDLPDALAAPDDRHAEEWRVHFHVPIFVADYGALRSTQRQLEQVLDLVRAGTLAAQLEIETYTWDVLPAGLKDDLVGTIGREYEWVIDDLA